MTWGIWQKFSSEHLKISKLVFSWDPFVQSRKCMSYKLTEELQVMTLKNGEKSEEELTCHFKTDIKNLTNFDSRTQSLKNYITKLYNVWAKKDRGVIFDCTQDWYKVWRKTGLCFQKLTWGIWQIFTRALESLQIGILMTYFCLKLKMYIWTYG